jgi:predicted RNase H-like HicB family nuclease
MGRKEYIFWQEDEMWLGYLEEYPDYWTQGKTEEDLKENLADLYKELTNGDLPSIRKVAELEVV